MSGTKDGSRITKDGLGLITILGRRNYQEAKNVTKNKKMAKMQEKQMAEKVNMWLLSQMIWGKVEAKNREVAKESGKQMKNKSF